MLACLSVDSNRKYEVTYTSRANLTTIAQPSESHTYTKSQHTHIERTAIQKMLRLFHSRDVFASKTLFLEIFLNKKRRKCIYFLDWYQCMCFCYGRALPVFRLHYCKLPDKCCANDAMPQNRLTSYAILDSLLYRIYNIFGAIIA